MIGLQAIHRAPELSAGVEVCREDVAVVEPPLLWVQLANMQELNSLSAALLDPSCKVLVHVRSWA